MHTKFNEYTGQSYECKCDYSYTCEECNSIREEFNRRARANERQQWIIDAIKAIAERVGVDLPPEP